MVGDVGSLWSTHRPLDRPQTQFMSMSADTMPQTAVSGSIDTSPQSQVEQPVEKEGEGVSGSEKHQTVSSFALPAHSAKLTCMQAPEENDSVGAVGTQNAEEGQGGAAGTEVRYTSVIWGLSRNQYSSG